MTRHGTRKMTALFETMDANLRTALRAGEETEGHMNAQRAANRRIAESSQALLEGGSRIETALMRIADSGSELRTAEARLLFENGRLKRSARGMRTSLERLGKAEDGLRRRAREAKALAEFAGRSADLIAEICACIEHGGTPTDLIERGTRMIDEGRKTCPDVRNRKAPGR